MTTDRTFSVATYDSFAAAPFGGSQAAVVSDAADIDRATRIRIARELGLPATGFVSSVADDEVAVQFFSTVMEQPMCGHGTVAVLTRLVEQGLVTPGERTVRLRLPKTTADVVVTASVDGPRVMLDVQPPDMRGSDVDPGRLASVLGLDTGGFHPNLPVLVVAGDFVHLAVPLRDLKTAHAVTPDFPAIVALCHAHGIETVAVFSLETEDPAATLHVRDFCPAVGVPESAGAGTTNAALACYLVRHGHVVPGEDGTAHLMAEQGMEVGRPSRVHSAVTVAADGTIARLQVGGTARKVMDGTLLAPA